MKNASLTASIFDRVASEYDAFRLPTPERVPLLLTEMLGRRPNLVVDLGAGTGLSTMVWKSTAERVIGIEPNNEMRTIGESKAGNTNIQFRKGDSGDTGLADGEVDIVVSTSALHWMDPDLTVPEVTRILRSGGLFAGITEVGSPTIDPAVEFAYQQTRAAASKLRQDRSLWSTVPRWDLAEYLARLRESEHFDYAKEICFHEEVVGNAAQFVGWARSVGVVRGVLREGFSEEEIGLPALRETAESVIGAAKPWHISYTMTLGVKKSQ